MRRWLVALLALVLGGGTAAVLLVAANPDAGTERVLAAAHGVPAGATLDAGAVQPVTVRLGAAAALAFPESAASDVVGQRTTHELMAGQVIQRSDVGPATATAALRSVYVPVRSAPPLAAGDHVDLLAVTGPAGSAVVVPFATGLLVRAQVGGAVIVAVDPAQAGALAYAGVTTSLIAVQASGGSGGEQPVGTIEQAEALARQ
jgi:hypothetical protein